MRAYHNLSFDHKLSTDMGKLVPIACMEVLPGDTFSHRVSMLTRLSPLVNPVMHDVTISVHHWYVPNRILWPEWEEWIVAKSLEEKPQIEIPATYAGTIVDHFGVPPATTEKIDALPVYAYNKIWNEFYRDQDLQAERNEDDTSCARVCWDKDYFTTARPYPQQGEAVEIGFSAGTAPVMGIGIHSPLRAAAGSWPYRDSDNESGKQAAGWLSQDPSSDVSLGQQPFFIKQGIGGFPQVYADLANATGGIDINDLRRSIALQRFAEARMRYGSRYVDYLRFLGVNPRDGRLDRPEYLGGGKQRVNFSEVLATAEGTNTKVGDMYGHGIAGLRSRRYRKMFEEHGWMLTLMSVRPKTSYIDAFPRKFQRFDPMDHWQKELEVLPWQEVKRNEIDYRAADATFGYVPRYDEYRHEFSYVSGTFRNGPEKDWHMGRDFESPPELNSSFVECTPTDRIYADKNMAELLINVRHKINAKRLVRQNAGIGSL